VAGLRLIRCAPLVFALAAAAALSSPARADFRIDGHGYGHGVGMPQYGAMGIAAETKHTYRWILPRYFPGTRLAAGPSARMRVRLKETTAARVALATLARDARGRRVTLVRTHVYRFVPWVADGLAVTDRTTGRTRAHLHSPVRLTGPAPMRVVGKAENGVVDGRYRGDVVVHRAAALVLVVDDARLESYLRGVVPAEMPAGWPTQALRAQSVVARSYALTSRSPGGVFDVFADTRSQVYRGVSTEHPRTDAAVEATGGIVVMDGSRIARTLFHSSSGGRTASSQEVFGGVPVPYLRSVDDPFDGASPFHDWSVTLSEAQAARQLATVLRGDLLDLQVVARTPSGRAATVRVTGTLGAVDVPGVTARSLLGLRSTWFAIRRL
jgi:stage II sporulation protein D